MYYQNQTSGIIKVGPNQNSLRDSQGGSLGHGGRDSSNERNNDRACTAQG